MPKRIRAVILCEDRQQEVFARYFLEQCGITPIRVLVGLPGRGSGEHFVRVTYPQQVKIFRSKFPNQPDTRLVVLTDADTRTVAERFKQLEDELAANNLAKRNPQDRIGIFIPKRSIETWIYYIEANTADEDQVYPDLDKPSDCKEFVTRLARNRQDPLPEDAPSSLQTACEELERVL